MIETVRIKKAEYPQKRVKSIDDFRGVTIALMFLANFIVLFTDNPPLLISHAKSELFLPLDLVAPFFGFALGVSFPFLRDKLTSSQFKKRLVTRVIFIYIVGKIPNLLYRYYLFDEAFLSAFTNSWSILETWALGFLLVFFLINYKLNIRLFFAFFILVIYQYLLTNFDKVYSYVNSMAEGGLIAVLSWSFIVVIGTVFGDMIKNKTKEDLLIKGLIICVSFIILGLLLHYFEIIPMKRLQVNASYITFSAGVSVLFFLIFHFNNPRWGFLFRNIGRYPLQAWILQSLFYIPVYLTVGNAYFKWPLGGALAFSGVVILVIIDELLLKSGVKLKV